MDPATLTEIRNAIKKGLSYTKWRKLTPSEQVEYPKCACGAPSALIAYCTLDNAACVACSDCHAK